MAPKNIKAPVSGMIIFFDHELFIANTPDQVRINKEIGNGAYGSVFEVEDCASGKKYAMKCLEMSPKSGYTSLMDISIMSTLQAPGLATAKDITTQDGYVYMLMELASCDLFHYLYKQKKSIVNIKKWIFQLIYAMYSLNHTSALHCDLKMNNILVYDTDDVKVCDFSLCMRRDWLGLYRGNVGSGNYRAPETIFDLTDHRIKWDERIDVWSLGCIIYEMYYRRPFIIYQARDKVPIKKEFDRMKNCYDDWANISQQDWLHGRVEVEYAKSDFVSDCQREDNLLWKFLHRLLKLNYLQRPTFRELLNDSFLCDIQLSTKYNIQSSCQRNLNPIEVEKVLKFVNPMPSDGRVVDFLLELYSRLDSMSNLTMESKAAGCLFLASKMTTGLPIRSRSFSNSRLLELEQDIISVLSYRLHFSFKIQDLRG